MWVVEGLLEHFRALGVPFKSLDGAKVSQIVSGAESTIQHSHMDYAPEWVYRLPSLIFLYVLSFIWLFFFCRNNDWASYWESAYDLGMTPLSLLHFPEGMYKNRSEQTELVNSKIIFYQSDIWSLCQRRYDQCRSAWITLWSQARNRNCRGVAHP